MHLPLQQQEDHLKPQALGLLFLSWQILKALLCQSLSYRGWYRARPSRHYSWRKIIFQLEVIGQFSSLVHVPVPHPRQLLKFFHTSPDLRPPSPNLGEGLGGRAIFLKLLHKVHFLFSLTLDIKFQQYHFFPSAVPARARQFFQKFCLTLDQNQNLKLKSEYSIQHKWLFDLGNYQ